MNLSWSVTVEWLTFGGLVVAGLIVAGVLLSIIFAAIKADEDAGHIEQYRAVRWVPVLAITRGGGKAWKLSLIHASPGNEESPGAANTEAQ